MKRVAEREGRADELLAALAAEADVLGTQATPAYLQIAKVYERMGRKDDALAALLAARRVTPNEPLVLSELAGIYETQGRYEELADVLLGVGGLHHRRERAGGHQPAPGRALRGGSQARARRPSPATRRSSRASPATPPRWRAWASSTTALQNWEGLVSVFDAEIAAAEDARAEGRPHVQGRRGARGAARAAGRGHRPLQRLPPAPAGLPARAEGPLAPLRAPGPLRRAGRACTSRICCRPPIAISSSPRSTRWRSSTRSASAISITPSTA